MTLSGRLGRRGYLQLSALLGVEALLHARPASAQAEATLRVRADTDIQKLDPMNQSGTTEELVNRAVLATLVRLSDLRQGSQIIKWGAETIEQRGPTAIAFTLLPKLAWTNGYGLVTAEDVKFSFERIGKRENDSPWRYQFERLSRVEVTGERSGIIHLTEPYEPFWKTSLAVLGGAIVCKAAYEKAAAPITTEHPATCGPYRLESWEPRRKLRLAGNPDWPGPKPAFGSVEIVFVEDDQAAALAYEARAFDYTRVAVSAAKRVITNPPPATKVIQAASTRYVMLTINIGNPKLSDPRVRQAIQYAFDADSVLAGAYNGLVPRSTGIVQPGTPFTRAGNLIAGRDVAKATQLLRDAGVSELTLELGVLNDTTSLTAAQIIQASLGEAGITVEVKPYDEGSYLSLGDKTQGDGYKKLELDLLIYAGGTDPSENLVWFRPDQIGAYNWSMFDSPEYEQLYSQGLSEADGVKRKAIYNRMEDLMEESGGFVFICHEPFVALHRATIEPDIEADGVLFLPGFTRA